MSYSQKRVTTKIPKMVSNLIRCKSPKALETTTLEDYWLPEKGTKHGNKKQSRNQTKLFFHFVYIYIYIKLQATRNHATSFVVRNGYGVLTINVGGLRTNLQHINLFDTYTQIRLHPWVPPTIKVEVVNIFVVRITGDPDANVSRAVVAHNKWNFLCQPWEPIPHYITHRPKTGNLKPYKLWVALLGRITPCLKCG